MALDVLSLGPFTFDEWATPEKLPLGGSHQVKVHKMPGGSRAVDCMGPDDIERQFSATLWGDTALADMLTLDQMRKAGEELPYSNGAESRTVIITEFLPQIRKFTCIEFSIKLLTVDDGDDAGGGFGGLDAVIGADLGAAMDLIAGAL